MQVSRHIAYSVIPAASVTCLWGVQEGLIFMAAAVLIDFDHYIGFVRMSGFREYGIKKAFKYHDYLLKNCRRPEFLNMEYFHNLESLVVIFVAALVFSGSLMWSFFAGFLYHNFLDMVYLYGEGVFVKRAYSFVDYFIRKKRLVQKGLYPDKVFHDAIESIK
ncbi:hypothetical protein ACFL6Y_00520 [Elusimicrobiota bacterium]